MTQVQSRQHHARFDPKFHFILVPTLLVSLVLSIVFVLHAVHRHAGLAQAIWALLVTLMLILTALTARMYALKVQDRVIRLEERLRMATLLPEDIRSRIPELSEDQLIGLRFASDGELAERVRETLELGLTRSQIKDRVQQWRPDNWRV